MKKTPKHPAVVIFLAAVIALSSIGLKYAYEKESSLSFTHTGTDGYVAPDKVIDVAQSCTFFDGNTLVATYKITKKDPYQEIDWIDLDYTLTVNGTKRDDYLWSYISSIDFGVDAFWTTVAIKNVSPDSKWTLTPLVENDVYVDNLTEYFWLYESGDSEDVMLEKYLESRSTWYNVVTIDSFDGQDVSYTVTTPDGEPDGLSGSFLLCFMDGDVCVFSAEIDYESIHDQDVSLSGTYHCPYSLPAYTDVQTIRIY